MLGNMTQQLTKQEGHGKRWRYDERGREAGVPGNASRQPTVREEHNKRGREVMALGNATQQPTKKERHNERGREAKALGKKTTN